MKKPEEKFDEGGKSQKIPNVNTAQKPKISKKIGPKNKSQKEGG